ncbi:hypothetical protein B0H13DRAFT_2675389 [Mycena leptocephala]|nr:hypothetical protein B0H13DRAFT_2675389 [Mycena leptocephala]
MSTGAYSASLSAAFAHAANWGGSGPRVGSARVLSKEHWLAPLRADVVKMWSWRTRAWLGEGQISAEVLSAVASRNAQNPGRRQGGRYGVSRVLSFRIPAAWYVFHKLYQLSAHNSLSATCIIFHAFAAASSMAVSLSARLCGLSGTRGRASAERREGNGV